MKASSVENWRVLGGICVGVSSLVIVNTMILFGSMEWTKMSFTLGEVSTWDLIPCGGAIHKVNWTTENCVLDPSLNSTADQSDLIAECFFFDAPLDWTTESRGECGNQSTPMFVQRVYPKALNPERAKGHFVLGNPGGPGYSQSFFQKKSLFDQFHNLTGGEFVAYVQKIRGVSGKGSLTCGNETTYAPSLSDAKEAANCFREVIEKRGSELRHFGYQQMAFDLRYTLQILRQTSTAPVTVYGFSGGTYFLQAYLGMFPKAIDQFDHFIFDGPVRPSYMNLLRSWAEGLETHTKMIMTSCLFESACMSKFRELRFCKGTTPGANCSDARRDDSLARWAPVVSILHLYEHLMGRIEELGMESVCMRRLVEAKKASHSNSDSAVILAESITSRNVTLAIKSMFSEWTQTEAPRPLIPSLVKKLHTCEYDLSSHPSKNDINALLQVIENGLEQLFVSTPSQLDDILFNPVSGMSLLVNEYTDPEDIEVSIANMTFEDLDIGHYDRARPQMMIRVAKLLVTDYKDTALYYRDEKHQWNITHNEGTAQPTLVLVGDMDGQTPPTFQSNHFAPWQGSDSTHLQKQKHYSFVIPFAPHNTLMQSRSRFREEFPCGMQLAASFVKNNGEVSPEDTQCLTQIQDMDLLGSRDDTKEAVTTFFGPESTLWT
eukprot:Nk52_evm20s2485 gene=Nk52_evmTU20s2485